MSLADASRVGGPLRRAFRHFGHHLRPYRGLILAGWLCMLGVTLMQLLRPWPLKLIFDAILVPGQSADSLAALPWLAGDTDLLLALCALGILGIAVLTGLFGYGHTYLLNGVGQRMLAAVRRQVYHHVQRLSHSFHDEHRSGDLLLRLTSDIRTLRELLLGAVLFVSERGLYVLGMAAIMLWMDWQLALLALAVLPPLAWLTRRFATRIRGASRSQRQREGQIASVIGERIAAIKLVQAFAREPYEATRFRDQEQATLEAGLQASRLEANLSRVIEVLLAVGTCAVVWFGVVRVQSGALTPGDLLVFIAYLKAMHKPVRKTAAFTSRLAKVGASAERLTAVMDTAPEVSDAPDAITAPALRGAIRFEAVGFRYANGTPALADVSLCVAPGEHLAIVGASGAGKSTLGSLLLRFYDPHEGRILIDGQDIRRYTLSSLRAQIATVLQESWLFSASIRENIAYGKLDASDEEIVRAARRADAHEFIRRLEQGYDAMVGEHGKTLSGGQRQRVAIARAMVRDAPILILDEPLSGLDLASRRNVRAALARLTAGRTTLHITHDAACAAEADRVLYMDGGRIAGLGAHRELLEHNPAYRRLMGETAPVVALQRGVA